MLPGPRDATPTWLLEVAPATSARAHSLIAQDVAAENAGHSHTDPLLLGGRCPNCNQEIVIRTAYQVSAQAVLVALRQLRGCPHTLPYRRLGRSGPMEA